MDLVRPSISDSMCARSASQDRSGCRYSKSGKERVRCPSKMIRQPLVNKTATTIPSTETYQLGLLSEATEKTQTHHKIIKPTFYALGGRQGLIQREAGFWNENIVAFISNHRN